jgi:hypothetical protein
MAGSVLLGLGGQAVLLLPGDRSGRRGRVPGHVPRDGCHST